MLKLFVMGSFFVLSQGCVLSFFMHCIPQIGLVPDGVGPVQVHTTILSAEYTGHSATYLPPPGHDIVVTRIRAPIPD